MMDFIKCLVHAFLMVRIFKNITYILEFMNMYFENIIVICVKSESHIF